MFRNGHELLVWQYALVQKMAEKVWFGILAHLADTHSEVVPGGGRAEARVLLLSGC